MCRCIKCCPGHRLRIIEAFGFNRHNRGGPCVGIVRNKNDLLKLIGQKSGRNIIGVRHIQRIIEFYPRACQYKFRHLIIHIVHFND